MFDAYSIIKGCRVNVKEVYNLTETFNCLNPDCSAVFSIRSPNGKITKHFARHPSTPHINGCLYRLNTGSFNENDHTIKSSIDSILVGAGTSINRDTARAYNSSETNLENHIKYIRTPNQLFKYCLYSSLDTVYSDNLTINDIVLDSRNLAENKRYEGVNGIRLLIGQTLKYEYSSQSIMIKTEARSSLGTRLTLYAKVKMHSDTFKKTIKYILESNNKMFSGYTIAVLGTWKIEEKYNISCVVTHGRNIVYESFLRHTSK